MQQRKSSLGYKIGIGFVLSLFLASILAIIISGYLLKQNFDERSQQSSMLVSRFVSSAISQYIGRMTSGLDALNGDADLLRDIFGSLGSASPRRRNFFKLFTKVEDFARQYELDQVSLYLKPFGREDYLIFSTIVPKENHNFTFSPERYGEDMIEITRDEYGLVTIKDDGLNSFNFRFANDFKGTERRIALISVDGKLYLDINYPLVNNLIGSEGTEDAFIRKGVTYGVIRIAMALPESFIASLEKETGYKINFYSSSFEYLGGVLEPGFRIPAQQGFVASGQDGVEYINYPRAVLFDESELAKVVVSLERNLLTQKITSMIVMIFGVNLVSSGLLWGALSLYLRKRVVRPIQRLTKSVKDLADGDLKSWQAIAQPDISERSDELEILSQAFRAMGQQLDELVNDLEGRVAERTAVIAMEKQKNQEILNNIGVGILTFDERLIVGDEYSRHLQCLLDLPRESIQGASFQSLILDRLNLCGDGRSTVFEILRCSLGMPPLSWELNQANLPLSMEVTVQGSQRYMSLDWYPMLNDKGIVERGMLVIKDQTEKVLLQKDLEKSQERHEILAELINVAMKYDMDYVIRFVKHNQSQLLGPRLEALLDMAKTRPEELFVLLHTLKGDARSTGFKRLAAKAHQAETVLHGFRSSRSEAPLQQLQEALSQLIDEITGFSQTLQSLFSKKEARPQQADCLIHALLPQFRDVVATLKMHGIKIGGFQYDDLIQKWSPRNLELIKDMIMHALTNSIDHGYIQPKLAGQATTDFARFQVKAEIAEGQAIILISDEGRGYDLERIRQKYQISPDSSDQETLAMLLESGVTTASSISNLSGRGVGLNAIKEISMRLGGSTCLERNYPHGARVRITLPLENVLLESEWRRVS
jgi:HAMP domain-containing protein/HPt (histidine-containing phosphotransfer) domain-containing protein